MKNAVGRPAAREPDYKNLIAVMEGRAPQRPTLFELFLDSALIEKVSGIPIRSAQAHIAAAIRANEILGYDYALMTSCGFHYPFGKAHLKNTISLNDSPVITDRASFDRYSWPDPKTCDCGDIDVANSVLPKGMKLLIWSADGLLETVIRLVGYENLCLMLYDDEALVSDIFERVGAGYYAYFERCVDRDEVMALVSSDDWGFNTQTLLPPKALRKYVFPWQRAYVRLAHSHGKYAVLHSCGAFDEIIDDIIDIGFDARHSYEDAIVPVEDAYDRLSGRIAVLGGIDMDFLTRSSEEEIRRRSRAMLERSAVKGGYALGSGNSIAGYVPFSHYMAMISCAWEE